MTEIGIDLLVATCTQTGFGKGRGRIVGKTGILTEAQVEITTAHEEEV